MNNSPKKSRNKRLSVRQKKAIEYLSVNGGKDADALRYAGYSPSIVNNPQKVFKSKSFAQALEKAGVSDVRVAKKYSRLLDATNLEKDTFYAEKIITKKGKKEIVEYKQLSNEKIKELIEGTDDDSTGCRISYIKTFETHKDVFFRAPDNVVQMGMVDKIGKVKSHFAPDKHEVETHELDESERKFLQSIMNQ